MLTDTGQTALHHKKFQKQIQRTQEIQNHPGTLLSRLAQDTKPGTPTRRAIRSQKNKAALCYARSLMNT